MNKFPQPWVMNYPPNHCLISMIDPLGIKSMEKQPVYPHILLNPKEDITQIKVKIEEQSYPQPKTKKNKLYGEQYSSNLKQSQQKKIEEKIVNKNLKEGRNSQSNVLRYFFKFIETDQMTQAFEKAKNMICPEVKKQMLLKWVRDNDICYKNYIRMSTLERLLKINKQFSRILYYMFRFYCIKYGRSHLLCSKKLKKQNLFHCLQSMREVDELFSIYC